MPGGPLAQVGRMPHSDSDVPATSRRCRPLKMAILGSKGIPAAYGGFETFAEHLAVGLTARGVDVTVYCEAGAELPPSYREVRLEYLPAVPLGFLTTILFDLRCLWHARRDFDVVYMLGYGASLFCFIPRLWGKEVWINMDGIEWRRSKWNRIGRLYLRIMERCALSTANRVIADAEGVRQSLRQRHRDLRHCSVIAYGAEPPRDEPPPGLLLEWSLAPQQYHLVVCRIEPENHVLEIVQGFLASKSRYPLVVVGNIASGTAYAKRLQEYASERVRFIGTVFEPGKLQALRYHCNAYFHGHSVGGTNPSLLEALACGSLVIAHDNDFNREVVDTAGHYFAEAGQIPALIEELENLDGEGRQRLRQTAREIVGARYTWDRIVGQYHDLLAAAVSDDCRPLPESPNP